MLAAVEGTVMVYLDIKATITFECTGLPAHPSDTAMAKEEAEIEAGRLVKAWCDGGSARDVLLSNAWLSCHDVEYGPDRSKVTLVFFCRGADFTKGR